MGQNIKTFRRLYKEVAREVKEAQNFQKEISERPEILSRAPKVKKRKVPNGSGHMILQLVLI